VRSKFFVFSRVTIGTTGGGYVSSSDVRLFQDGQSG
jgi:hypothetical protein